MMHFTPASSANPRVVFAQHYKAVRERIETRPAKVKVRALLPAPPIAPEPIVVPFHHEDVDHNAHVRSYLMHKLDLIESNEPARPAVTAIVNAVCVVTGTRRNDLLSNRRTANIIMPRHIAMYLARHLTPASLPEIGRRIGKRDHTTAIYAIRKIGDMQGDPAVQQTIGDVCQLLGVPAP